MNAPLVKVIWDDAEDAASTWYGSDDIAEFSEAITLVISVGFKVSETAKYVTLAADWVAGLEQFGRITKIPRGVIVSIEEFTA
jgi:hypothetical protein